MYYRVKRLFSIYVACHAPDEGARLWMRLRLLPGFIAAGIRALPHALRWARLRDPAARARVKQILDLSGPAPIAMVPSMLTQGEALAPPDGTCVTVVMPVYNNLVMAQEAMRRVVEHTDISWRMVIVDDASPSPDVRPASANAGLEKASEWGDPVVLLNTDAYVPQGWARRLLAPIWGDRSVASVTPMSNDAELGCVPMLSCPQDIDADLADRLDLHAAGLNGAIPYVNAPAGVGFCMAMSPIFLRKLPQFDTVFAPGYGEEVDWCQKVANQGGQHVYVPNLFVAHVGGQSFGSDKKAKLIARNSEVLSRPLLSGLVAFSGSLSNYGGTVLRCRFPPEPMIGLLCKGCLSRFRRGM